MKEIESYLEILILVHAGLGAIALITCALAIFSKKGSLLHKKVASYSTTLCLLL